MPPDQAGSRNGRRLGTHFSSSQSKLTKHLPQRISEGKLSSGVMLSPATTSTERNHANNNFHTDPSERASTSIQSTPRTVTSTGTNKLSYPIAHSGNIKAKVPKHPKHLLISVISMPEKDINTAQISKIPQNVSIKTDRQLV